MSKSIVIEGWEYARFGDGWVARAAATDDDWAAVRLDDVPAEVIDRIDRQEARGERIRQFGYDPEDPAPGRLAIQVRRSVDNTRRAAELGLTADELAERLNRREAGGTRERVTDKRFDELAGEIGMDPEEMRERFRGGPR
jgi:hypothetical protein